MNKTPEQIKDDFSKYIDDTISFHKILTKIKNIEELNQNINELDNLNNQFNIFMNECDQIIPSGKIIYTGEKVLLPSRTGVKVSKLPTDDEYKLYQMLHYSKLARKRLNIINDKFKNVQEKF